MRVLVVLALVPLLFVQAPPATPPGTPTPPPVHDRCVAVPPGLIEWVSAGILPETAATLGPSWMVKSDDFENVWFVAADLEGPDLDGPDHVAVWATNAPAEDGTFTLGEGGLVLAVSGFALEFTDWPDGGETDAQVSMSNDGAELAEDCAKGED